MRAPGLPMLELIASLDALKAEFLEMSGRSGLRGAYSALLKLVRMKKESAREAREVFSEHIGLMPAKYAGTAVVASCISPGTAGAPSADVMPAIDFKPCVRRALLEQECIVEKLARIQKMRLPKEASERIKKIAAREAAAAKILGACLDKTAVDPPTK